MNKEIKKSTTSKTLNALKFIGKIKPKIKAATTSNPLGNIAIA